MSQLPIGISSAAGNAVDATVYTCPAGSWAFISAIIATNTTGGGLTITLKIGNRVGTSYTILSANTVNANTTNSYSVGHTASIAPIVLNAGETFLAQGSGSGITVTIGGLVTTLPQS